MARELLRKSTNNKPCVAAIFHSDLLLMMSRAKSHDLAQFLFRISLLITFKPLDFIQASYSCMVSNSTNIPFSIGMIFFLYSAGFRFGFLNQSMRAIVPLGFSTSAAEAKKPAMSW